uniref:Zinc knuckle CX2CX4HX4C n=1 Tax=Tanacetum cinerariifolium TaxID=118510 RepID=A0A6L2LPF1_TANCI|nr:zinc knuckle CX2CX4HX4C [Tanacetum cinerariifolium]
MPTGSSHVTSSMRNPSSLQDVDAAATFFENSANNSNDILSSFGLAGFKCDATFGVPLTTVGDLHKLINDIEAGKHDELSSQMTNDDHMETMDAICTICNSSLADNYNADVIPCKVVHVDESINLNVDESTIPSDPIVQSVDINTKSTSYAGATVVKKVSIGFEHTLNGYFIGKRMTFPVVTTSNVVTPTVKKTNDGFQTVGKKKKRKGKSKSTNVGQFVGPSVKQNVRYEPKATTSAPMKGVTNVGKTSQSSSMLKTTGGRGLVVVGGRSFRMSRRAWGEVGGVENKSLMGSMLIAKGEECLDGWVGAGRGEVKGCSVDFEVTKSLLSEILEESSGEEFVVVNRGAV